MAMTVIIFSYGICSASGLDAFKGEKGVLRISGGTAHIPVIMEVAKRIMTANPDIQITISEKKKTYISSDDTWLVFRRR